MSDLENANELGEEARIHREWAQALEAASEEDSDDCVPCYLCEHDQRPGARIPFNYNPGVRAIPARLERWNAFVERVEHWDALDDEINNPN